MTGERGEKGRGGAGEEVRGRLGECDDREITGD